MKNLLLWIVSVLIFAGIGAFVAWQFERAGESQESEGPAAETRPAAEPVETVTRDQAGRAVVHFDHDTLQRLGVQTAPLRSAAHQPELLAYGTLEENPSLSFTLRAPLPGTLRPLPDRPWPNLGERFSGTATVGAIEPRLTPLEQSDLAARLAAARADVQEAQASLVAQRASYESKLALNKEQRIVSERSLQEAEAQVKGQEARLAAAKATVQVIESFLSTTTRPSDAIPLVVPATGQIVELVGQPGEAVESGQVILRTARLDRLLARIALPAGQAMPSGVSIAHIVVPGHEKQRLTTERFALAPAADPTTGSQTFLFAVAAEGRDLQPGMGVTAYLQLPGEPLTGVVVPGAAVLRITGRTWVYLQTDAEHFTRCEVALAAPVDDGWFVAGDLAPGDIVVMRAAQTLLSEELRFQAGGGEEEE